MIHKVIKAERIKGTYKLNLQFRNWEKKIFDAKNYVWWKSFIFWPLKNDKTFDLFKVKDWTVVWETWADFCPNVLYEKSVLKN